jgi:hypothetical protein
MKCVYRYIPCDIGTPWLCLPLYLISSTQYTVIWMSMKSQSCVESTSWETRLCTMNYFSLKKFEFRVFFRLSANENKVGRPALSVWIPSSKSGHPKSCPIHKSLRGRFVHLVLSKENSHWRLTSRPWTLRGAFASATVDVPIPPTNGLPWMFYLGSLWYSRLTSKSYDP